MTNFWSTLLYLIEVGARRLGELTILLMLESTCLLFTFFCSTTPSSVIHVFLFGHSCGVRDDVALQVSLRSHHTQL